MTLSTNKNLGTNTSDGAGSTPVPAPVPERYWGPGTRGVLPSGTEYQKNQNLGTKLTRPPPLEPNALERMHAFRFAEKCPMPPELRDQLAMAFASYRDWLVSDLRKSEKARTR